MTRSSAPLLGLALLLATASVARAATITWTIGGTVDSVTDGLGILGGISAGNAFTGTISFDSDAVDLEPSAFQGGYLMSPAGILGISIEIAGTTFEQDPTQQFVIALRDCDTAPGGCVTGGSDFWHAQSNGDPTGFAGLDASDQFGIDVQLFNDAGGSAISSDALPLSPPSLNDFPDLTELSIFLEDSAKGGQQSRIFGTVELLVPEPSPSLLSLVGLLGSIVAGRPRRSSERAGTV